MLDTININLKTDIKTDNPTTLPIKLMSQDKKMLTKTVTSWLSFNLQRSVKDE